MNAGSSRLKASSLMAELAANGRYHFTTAEMRAALGVSEAATRLSLSRLAQKRLIASPARGFYVILPPEYKRLGCLPADQFIPALMAHLKRPYYAALLSAAQYHGAAHHRPQTFQVALDRSRRSISCGAVDVSFIVRKRLSEVPIQNLNTPRGTVRVSSVEATAVDVVGYEKQIGGGGGGGGWIRWRPFSPNSPHTSIQIFFRQRPERRPCLGRSASDIFLELSAQPTRHRPSRSMSGNGHATSHCFSQLASTMARCRSPTIGVCASTLQSK